ncbi:MAG TPA: response regulator [Polyangia bacterium]|jgi:DNA-binding NtrC family response regulator
MIVAGRHVHRAGARFELAGSPPSIQIGEVACDIVLVEDDEEFAESLAEVLRDEGHGVTVFTLPEEAIEWLLSGQRAALVLLDLRTPGMSAQRFRAMMMATPALRALPVVVVSGDPNIRRIAGSIGASDALEKPVDVSRLLATIDRHCQARPPTKAGSD